MTGEVITPAQGDALRRRAEGVFREKTAGMKENMEARSPEETRQTLHELQVHQIELEMQNEELRRAQAELDASRARYFDLYDLAPVGYFTLSDQGLILEANLTAADLLGVTRGALVKKPLTHFILPADQDIYYRHRKLLFKTRAPQMCETRMVKKDAAPFWAQMEARLAQDVDGAPVYRAVMIDITARKRTEEALRESEKFFKEITENASDIIIITDKNGDIKYCSRSIERFTGYNPEELIGRSGFTFIHPDDVKRAVDDFGKAILAIDSAIPNAFRIVHKDGSERYFDGLGKNLLDNPAIAGFIMNIRDITDRKQAEEALRTSEAHYRLLAEHMTDIVWMMDLDLNVTWLSPSAMKARAFSVDEIAALPLDKQLTPESLGKAVNWLGKLMSLEKDGLLSEPDGILSRELEFYCKDGRTIVLDCSFQFTRDEQGKATGILAEGKDITARKQAEEKLRTSRSQLRALAMRLQTIREEERLMVAREIHDEMGGGLTGLKMDLSWLLGKMGDADSCEARVALMDRIQTSNALIDQMIHIVRRISTDLRPSVLDDLGLIAALEWQLSEFTSRTEISHEFATTFKDVNMEADTAIAVFRIFQEALTNVVRHSRATKVAVVLRGGERSLFGEENFVLEIRDNGRGITEEEILNPGSLGLLGMKERILAFRGKLSISGEPGGGTALVLQIPRKQGEPS